MKDLLQQGITATTVRRVVTEGHIEAVSRGTYRRLNAPYVRWAAFAEVAARAPRAVVCLFSAAEFHGLTDVAAPSVWIGVPNQLKPPRIERPTVRVVQWRNPASMTVGVEEHAICGINVRVTSAARTVVDMLKMASTVGEDRAFESLRDYAAAGRPLQSLQDTAEALGVARRLGPWLKAFSYMVRHP